MLSSEFNKFLVNIEENKREINIFNFEFKGKDFEDLNINKSEIIPEMKKLYFKSNKTKFETLMLFDYFRKNLIRVKNEQINKYANYFNDLDCIGDLLVEYYEMDWLKVKIDNQLSLLFSSYHKQIIDFIEFCGELFIENKKEGNSYDAILLNKLME